MERLDKFLCDSGAGTRSQVKQLLKAGRVTVDGKPEKDPGRKIDPAANAVQLDGSAMGGYARRVVMMNKPMGYVTATEDAKEKTVMELLPEQMRHWDLKPIGRLDKQTEGLLLLTNDGDLLHRLISPKKEVPKGYYAAMRGRGPQRMRRPLRRGRPCGTARSASRPSWSPLAPGKAGSRCARENITRSAG